MKNVLILIVALLLPLAMQAQGVFKFETESKNFGEIVEGVQATHEFNFTNTGDAPIVITNVRASCGCTTPEWPKEPIMPGEGASIKAIYNSKGRPGAFNKTITITSNATESIKQLTINGTVSSDPNKQAEQASERALVAANGAKPAISLLVKEHNFGTIQAGNTVNHSFKYKNTGAGDLSITATFSTCRCVSFTTDKPVLKPGETATMEISYTPKKPTDKPEKVYFSSNAPYNAEVYLLLSGKVVESLAPKSIMQESSGIKF